jgi:hypothetical protein
MNTTQPDLARILSSDDIVAHVGDKLAGYAPDVTLHNHPQSLSMELRISKMKTMRDWYNASPDPYDSSCETISLQWRHLCCNICITGHALAFMRDNVRVFEDQLRRCVSDLALAIAERYPKDVYVGHANIVPMATADDSMVYAVKIVVAAEEHPTIEIVQTSVSISVVDWLSWKWRRLCDGVRRVAFRLWTPEDRSDSE